jgi:long-chain fatty acid transport protein
LQYRRAVRRCIARVACFALLTVPWVAQASPQDLFGYGARNVGLAGTGAAYADDYAAVHANPAGLSRLRARTLTVGYAASGFALQVADEYLRADPGSAAVIGVGLPLPFVGVLRDRLALGVGFFTPTDVVVRGRIVRATTPQFVVLPDRVQTVALQAGLGVSLGCGFRVGVGFMAMAALTGAVVVVNDAAGRSSARIDNQLVASYAPVLGASWEHGPWRVGATFRGALVGRFSVTISAPEIGIPLPVLDIGGVAQYDPAQLHIEGAWQHRGFTAVVALTGKRWSEYPGPSVPTTVTSTAPPAPDFSDTVVPRVALEHRWTFSDGAAFSLRAGYFFEPTPAPRSTRSRQYLDNHRHVASLGMGLATPGPSTRFVLDVFAQVHGLVSRTGENTSGDPVAYGGLAWHLGVTSGVTF